MLYVVSKVMECETFFNEAPFNSIESFAKIKLYKNTWNVMYICLFYDVVDQSNRIPPSPPPPTLYLPFTKPVWPGLLENQNLF